MGTGPSKDLPKWFWGKAGCKLLDCSILISSPNLHLAPLLANLLCCPLQPPKLPGLLLKTPTCSMFEK